MWRVRIAFALYGILVAFISKRAVVAGSDDAFLPFVGIKLLFAPFALEYAIGVFADAIARSGGRVPPIGVRVLIYPLSILMIVGSAQALFADGYQILAYQILVYGTPIYVLLYAGVIRRLVYFSAGLPIPESPLRAS